MQFLIKDDFGFCNESVKSMI